MTNLCILSLAFALLLCTASNKSVVPTVLASSDPSSTAGITEKNQKDAKKRLLKNKTPKSTAPPVVPISPNIFSIMRYGHEVIRGTMKLVNVTLEQGDLDDALEIYHKLEDWGVMHKLMEEGNNDGKTPKGFFSVLDEKFDNIAVNNQLRELHDELEATEAALSAAIATNDLLTIKNAFSSFQTINDAHLVKEESIMMPKVAEMKAQGVNLKALMTTELLALVVKPAKEFKFFVEHANRILENEPKVLTIEGQVVNKAVVFDQALWACATNKQWKAWKKWIKKSLKKSTYGELMEVIKNSA